MSEPPIADTSKKAVRRLATREGYDAESIAWGFAAHLKYTQGVDSYTATPHDKYMSLAYAVRDRLVNQWMHTQRTHHERRVKRVYYLSLEFLIGRSMTNNVINLGLEEPVRDAMLSLGYKWEDLREEEADAGLGNGGLGRLAACFLDSLATLQIPAWGYGLRYDYGIFRQVIENGYQVEQPDYWLRGGNPWEVERHDVRVPVHFGGRVLSSPNGGRSRSMWVETQPVLGIAYDTPVVGYNGATVNTLRLWSARAAEEFDFKDFDKGDYVEAVRTKVSAETITKVLYPNDKLYLGKELRDDGGDNLQLTLDGSGEEESAGAVELGFIRDTLSAFRGFVLSDLNLDWTKVRLAEWRDRRSSEGRGVQLTEPSEADDFLESFYSPYTGELWGESYAGEVEALLPEVPAGTLSAWNPGCGKGYESYSFAALLARHYHGKRIKVWANDNDLLGISMAPTLAFHEEAIPPLLTPFVTKTRNGFSFKQELKDSILFEYHDILHPNPFPEVDLVLARDILSFFSLPQQQALIELFRSKLRVGGILFIGSNERLPDSGWREIRSGAVRGYERLADEEPLNKEQVT